MAIFNSLYCKKNYLPEDRTAIMPGMVNIPNSFDHYEAKPEETIMEIIKELDKLIKPSKLPYYKKPSRTHRVQRLKAKQKKISNRPLIEVDLNDLTDVDDTESNRDFTEVDKKPSKLI